MNKTKLTVIDLFSGVGGLSNGFERAGYKISAAVEFDTQIAESFQINHTETKMYNLDIETVFNEGEIFNYKPDVIVGGPPCQGFSMAGARIRKDAKKDERNDLFTYYHKIVKKLEPQFFLFENVTGLLTMDNGKVFQRIIKTFAYKNKATGNKYYLYHKVFKASDFGIPQKRQRVFIIGSLNKKIDFEKIFLITKQQILKNCPEFFSPVTVWDAISNLNCEDSSNEILNLTPETPYQKYLFSNKVTNHILPSHSEKVIKRLMQIKSGDNYKVLNENIKSIHSGSYGRLNKTDQAATITTRFDTPSGGRFIHPEQNRTLTPREGARIQSFPDDFEFTGTKTSIYKQIGNAVPPKIAYFFAESIKNAMKDIRI